MDHQQASAASRHEAGNYEIRVAGHLGQRWAAWFDELTLTHEDGTTVLHGPVVDQAALHGLLQKIRDLGLPLVSVAQVAPEPPATPLTPTTHQTTTHQTTAHQTTTGSTA